MKEVKRWVKRGWFTHLIKGDRSLLLLIVMLLCSFLIRISLIDDSDYYGHGDYLIRPAEDFITNGKFPGGYSGIGQSGAQYGPILIYLFSIFLFIWYNIYTLYLFSIALWCVATFFVYKIGRECFGVHTGLIASIFVSFHALSLIATTDNSNSIFTAPFAAMFIYSLFKVKFKEDTRYWILCFFSIGFLLQIHVSAFVCLLILTAFLLFKPKLDLKYISIGLLVLIMLFIPYLVHLVKTDFRDIRMMWDYTSRVTGGGSGHRTDYLKLNINWPRVNEDGLFLKLLFTSMLYLISSLIYTCLKRTNTVKVKKYSLLLLMFILSYIWLIFFPYVSYYSLTFMFIITCLIAAEFLDWVIKLFLKKNALIVLLYLVLILWIYCNITAVNGSLCENKREGQLYFKLEKAVAETILKHSKNIQGKVDVTQEEYNEFYSHLHTPNLFYYESIIGGELTRHFLKKEKWYPPDREKVYLIIRKEKLPFKKVKAEFSEEIEEQIIINFDSLVNRTCRLSTEYHEGWFLNKYNDSDWNIAGIPIFTPDLTNAKRIPDRMWDKVLEEDLFLRLVLINKDENLDKCILLSSTFYPLFLEEIYINDYKIYTSFANNPDERNESRTYELSSIKEHLNPGENIIGIHLKQKLIVPNLIKIFVLSEKE